MAGTKTKPEDKIEETAEEAVTEEEFDMDAYLRELVDFYAFKDNGKYKDDIIVGVNGRIFQIKRGVPVKIPRYVYNVIVGGMDQDARTAELIEKETSAYAAASQRFGV